jgi:UDP-N-acetylmuramoyl-tripeptide--D-alanyl-D-alanine ligase
VKISELLTHMTTSVVEGDMTREIRGFSTDSRLVKKGFLFFALDGKNHSGVDFVSEIIRRGAVCIVAEKKHKDKVLPFKDRLAAVFVEDMISALREAASWYRQIHDVTVIAVTGSNGKTTTKELLAGLLRLKYKVHSTFRNLNNEIGVPLTLFGLRRSHQVLVVECGINHPGEMDRLAGMVKPDYAVLTNVGATHLEFMGSVENVAKEKSRLLAYTGKKAFYNLEMPFAEVLNRYPLEKISVSGRHAEARVHFENVTSLGLRGYSFVFEGIRGRTSFYGEHNLDNLAMAFAVAKEMGIHAKKLVAAARRLKPMESRSMVYGGKGLDLMDESYNSNYSSLSRSLDFLGSLEGYTCKSVVIGEMGELGESSQALHAKIGERLSGLDVQRIYLVGAATKHILDAYRGPAYIEYFTSTMDLEKPLIADFEICGGKNILLVKGSRSNRLDEIVKKMVKRLRLKAGPYAL